MWKDTKFTNKFKAMKRREFFKSIGSGAIGSSALLAACTGKGTGKGSNAAEPPKDKMTMRENPNTHEMVSLLGYGMMRLPVEGGGSGRENPDADIDQEMVNRQVDYAIDHGVNYFDTSPAYCQGRSEHCTGIALSRHPRNKYFIATKLSNFSPASWPRKESIAMFENSLKELQVDYIDYLLMHGTGMGAQDSNGKAVSLPGYQNQRGGYNDLRNYAKTYSDTGASAYAMIEPSAVWHYEWLLMTIEFATTNMQTIMYGAAYLAF